jgi:hypothetical protein
MRRELILRASIPAPLPTGLQIDSEQEVAASRRSVGFRDIQVGTGSSRCALPRTNARTRAGSIFHRGEQFDHRLPPRMPYRP